ncbi:unnamed protein product (macronuclear) [Paramecium tetraurelia]|uniref:Transmembrane protein n=1 Tax=Paramecium tetraurelia TaxID=5888 RepID=A0CDP0_PARTE|nr:uncharacterized protein GSPATT00007119001 [Paramecium tetraurelia]CAK68907.1 unnamed protein product [Paramecium tetraurelia]|eukprot:XP_001436304.1 hypothetical protein (macronuclear) [Paramecium tetraurelia strain d4-2]
MINLNEEQKIQQNKLVNIFGQHAKQAVIIFIMNALLRVQENDTFFMSITLYLTIIMFLFNCVAAVFLLCFKREFPKIEYFLIYTMNVFMFIILLVYSLNYFIQKKEQDHLLQLYLKTYIMILLGKEIEILIIKIFPIELTNRSVNCFTSCIIAMMILSHGDNYECQNKYSMVLLSLLLSNILTSIFNIVFTLILFNQNRSQKELRNFADLLLTVLFLVHLAQYVLVFIKTNAIIEQECQCLSFIFQFQKYVAPINFISFLFVIYQEVYYFKEAIKYQELIEKNTQHNNMCNTIQLIKLDSGGIQNQQPFKQGVRHSIKSLSSVVNPMEASQSNSQAPNFGTYAIQVNQSDNQGQKLEKMGTSQFGASQHNQGMQHSWANVQNPNPFGTIVKEQQDSIENQKRGSKSVDESLIRQEESQIPENLSQVNNPMESGSVVTIH